ncbi:methyltransferase family protein [Pelagibacterium montanilacus]|uniref:methyltransferase family protein n=1 Tax=Pelagibacterium montanilacus TaxID=2185280 RepID=UPI000F8E2B69|nr:isoprenylcysteine carboxylmethyltransferase family protein [Pelagibacterium montanilacus]
MVETAFDALVTVAGLVTVGAYVWSVQGHFKSDSMPAGARLIAVFVIASTLLLASLTWAFTQPLPAQALGLAIQLAAGALFVWAIGTSKRARLRFVFDHANPQTLVTEGPYRLVRHPFYVSYAIFWAGWSLAVWHLLALVGLIPLLCLYVWAAQLEERSFEGSEFAAQYARYKERTGFFIPRP